jgi:hypothetical protein
MREEIKRWLNNVRLGHHNERALVIVGGRSSGKTTFATLAAQKCGLKPEHVGTFETGDLEDRFFFDKARRFPLVVINVKPEEVDDVLSILKAAISNRQISVDRLGKSSVVVNNQMNFMILTEKYDPQPTPRRVLVASPIFAMNVLTEL